MNCRKCRFKTLRWCLDKLLKYCGRDGYMSCEVLWKLGIPLPLIATQSIAQEEGFDCCARRYRISHSVEGQAMEDVESIGSVSSPKIAIATETPASSSKPLVCVRFPLDRGILHIEHVPNKAEFVKGQHAQR